jgi:hypothetical protein
VSLNEQLRRHQPVAAATTRGHADSQVV